MSEWISVEDRLPDDVSVQGMVVCIIDNKHIAFGEYADNYGKFACYGYGITDDVTHWMPLPEPPTQE